MSEFVTVIISAIVSAGVATWFSRLELEKERGRRLPMYWTALYSEAELAAEMVHKYLQDDVMWPLYRLPTTAHRSVYASVLAEAKLTRDEARSLAQFFVLVDEFNRGMERADGEVGGKPLREERVRLLKLKGPRLLAYWHGDEFDGVKHDSIEALLREHANLLPLA